MIHQKELDHRQTAILVNLDKNDSSNDFHRDGKGQQDVYRIYKALQISS